MSPGVPRLTWQFLLDSPTDQPWPSSIAPNGRMLMCEAFDTWRPRWAMPASGREARPQHDRGAARGRGILP
jgi:hypothetical protein